MPSMHACRLHLHKLLWSSKGPAEGGLLTVVTAATASRLDTLEAQCQAWPGLLSAAVYMPLQQQPLASTAGQSQQTNQQELVAVEDAVQRLFDRCASTLFAMPSCVPCLHTLLQWLSYPLVWQGRGCRLRMHAAAGPGHRAC